MSQPPVHEQIGQMMTGYWISQSIYVAAKLGIADLLRDGPRPVRDLATATDTHAASLYRLLRALASLGVFAEGDDRTFALTPLAETLRSDAPRSQRAMVMMMGEEHYHVWGDLLYSVQTGEIAFDKTYGMPIFDYLAKNPQQARTFDDAMTAIHGHETVEILAAYNFSGIGTLADVGGGNGSTIAAILETHSDMKGLLFDLAHVVERARDNLQAAGVADRCDAVEGDFFESLPRGADAYLLRHIIHDWDDANAITILANCRQAMGNDGKVLIVESVIPAGNKPFQGKLLDIVMMLIPGGLERTEDQYRELLNGAGLRLNKIVPTSGEISVIEAVPE